MRGNKFTYIVILAVVFALLFTIGFDVKSGDSITIFDNQVIPEGDIITGDAVAIFGNLEIRGDVRGDIVSVFGSIDLYGEVTGDAVAVFGNIEVHRDAVIGGDAVGVFGSVDKHDEATIRGEKVETKDGFEFRNFDFAPNMSFGTIFGMMVMYGLSCLVVAIAPDRIIPMVYSSKQLIGRHLGIGLLVMLIFILLIPILVITIIGIIPALLLILSFVIIVFMSTTAAYIALGEKIAAAVEGKNAVYIHLLIGMVVVNALTIIPFVGALASLAVFLVGLGVAFETRVGGLLARKRPI